MPQTVTDRFWPGRGDGLREEKCLERPSGGSEASRVTGLQCSAEKHPQEEERPFKHVRGDFNIPQNEGWSNQQPGE